MSETINWKIVTREWDMTEYWCIVTDDDDETRIVMEPTDFFAYDSGSFISPEGQQENAKLIVGWCNLARKHFGPNALKAAESDAMSDLIAALRRCIRNAPCSCAEVGDGFVCEVCEAKQALYLLPDEEGGG